MYVKQYIACQGRKIRFFRPCVEFAVRVEGVHAPKASAFCEPKMTTAITRGQNARLALAANRIFFYNARVTLKRG